MALYKGINYDIGTKTLTGGLTREKFDINTVTRELDIIKNELHCNAIRISGLHINRLVQASAIALRMGLTVWFSPALHYESQENTLQYITDSADAAEALRSEYPNIIFVIGCELSLFTKGFVKGDTGEERIINMFSPLSMVKNMLGIRRTYNTRLNKFLSNAVAETKKRFHGQVTYASGTWEKADWSLFDMIGVDHYRAIYNKTTYLKELQKYKIQGKPLCMMEFGCCTYRGAEDKGAMGWAIVDWKKDKPELKGDYIRDEDVQAEYLVDTLKLLEGEDVYAAFPFTFVTYNYPHNADPRYDLDIASYGIVKAVCNGGHKGLNWLPKKAFYVLAAYYNTTSDAEKHMEFHSYL